MDQMADLQTKLSRALLDPAQPVPSAIHGATRRGRIGASPFTATMLWLD